MATITTLVPQPEGLHSGYGFNAVYMRDKNRWILSDDEHVVSNFLSLAKAKEYVEMWLDKNKPNWREEQKEARLAKLREKDRQKRGAYKRND